MEERPKPHIRGVLLVWVVGLTLGIIAGATTAMLLMPGSAVSAGSQTLADRMRAN
jgi:gas vesicle protein